MDHGISWSSTCGRFRSAENSVFSRDLQQKTFIKPLKHQTTNLNVDVDFVSDEPTSPLGSSYYHLQCHTPDFKNDMRTSTYYMNYVKVAKILKKITCPPDANRAPNSSTLLILKLF